ncbi:hypothetical protein BDP81DRAFT_51857 [Colletotrichum phormii]|uniref:Uncharacterized protein n=1 Tax=Colletotrichum phormii TaxID=359342 RepID=A0AAJ0EF45_9PEZI|nr:uncharacterized protein BDP81DRAFT_51857 [Colletotrichum phormii]KAK1634721.1 hypothetical protein BDP81DRAFT_51857 [Colletotrichum phormii]
MCNYVLLVPICQHNPILLFETSCHLVLKELQRINKPAAWEGSALFEIPFRVPEPCHPGPDNIQPIHTSDSCHMSCQNTIIKSTEQWIT